MILQKDSGPVEVHSLPFHSFARRESPKMPTQLAPREPTHAQLLIQCGRYIAGITVLLVAVALFELRLVRASHATARLGERIGGGPPVFS
jgi:hypothetical protein